MKNVLFATIVILGVKFSDLFMNTIKDEWVACDLVTFVSLKIIVYPTIYLADYISEEVVISEEEVHHVRYMASII
jgi:hypothetical protein